MYVCMSLHILYIPVYMQRVNPNPNSNPYRYVPRCVIVQQRHLEVASVERDQHEQHVPGCDVVHAQTLRGERRGRQGTRSVGNTRERLGKGGRRIGEWGNTRIRTPTVPLSCALACGPPSPWPLDLPAHSARPISDMKGHDMRPAA